MNFNVGDRVKFLDEVGEAIVMHVFPDGKLKVLTTEGFELIMERKQLVLISAAEVPDKKEPESTEIEKKMNVPEFDPDDVLRLKEEMFNRKPDSVPHRKLETQSVEVDLHIEELLDNTSGMSSGEKLTHQILVFRQKMEQALHDHLFKIVFIHGVGNGKLRSEIRSILKEDYPKCEFYDASMSKYGQGATEVRLRH